MLVFCATISVKEGERSMERLKRKIDDYLLSWKANNNRKPLIIKGARQIGKTEAVRHFAHENYGAVVEINFVLQKQYRDIFDDGFEVDTIIRNISLKNPALQFIPGKTLLFFDELQDCIKRHVIHILDDATIAAMKEKRARDKARDAVAAEQEALESGEATDWQQAMAEWEAWEKSQKDTQKQQ